MTKTMTVLLVAGMALVSQAGGLAQAQAVNPPGSIDLTMPIYEDPDEKKPLKDWSKRAGDADRDCAKCDTVRLGWVLAEALTMATCPQRQPGQEPAPSCTPEERNLKPDELWGRYELARKLRRDPAIALSSDQVTLLKRMVGWRFPFGQIIAQVYPALDPTEKPAEVGKK